MGKKEYLEMLNSIEPEENQARPGPHERVIFIDGLNLFLRNFAILNFVNESGNHIGGLAGFLRSLVPLLIKFNQLQFMLYLMGWVPLLIGGTYSLNIKQVEI
jgi:hypothetical protein